MHMARANLGRFDIMYHKPWYGKNYLPKLCHEVWADFGEIMELSVIFWKSDFWKQRNWPDVAFITLNFAFWGILDINHEWDSLSIILSLICEMQQQWEYL